MPSVEVSPDFEVPTEQETLKAFIERRHPEYECNLAHWDFLQATYKGGRDWFVGNLFKYVKEGDTEFEERLERAYRFNHTREVVDLVNKYVFRGEVIRNEVDAPVEVKAFWKNATKSNLDITRFMEQVGQQSSIFGRLWLVVDNNVKERPRNKAEEKKLGARCYAYYLRPQDALDMGFDDMGNLTWFLAHETWRSDKNPFEGDEFRDRYRLWTKNFWYVFEVTEEGVGKKKKIVITKIGEGNHGLGIVPIFKVDHQETEDLYTSPALIGDTAYLDRASANYLSNLDAIIQDQTFSQLVIPAQALLPGEEGYDKLVEMGTKRIFTFDGESGVSPEYISPDPKQATVILSVINKIIGEIYHSVGMAGERTKQDNAVGIENSSGVAKAYDFERVNSLLVSKAKGLDHAENKLIELVMLWHGNKKPPEKDLVKYPDSYDVRGLYDEFEVAAKLALIGAPDTVRREQMMSLMDKLFPRLAEDLRKKMDAELKSWPPEPEIATPPALKDPKKSRQGQVTDDKEKSPKPK
jgi:hypothetical protein